MSLDQGGMARSFLITIAITAMDTATKAMTDPLDRFLPGGDIEGTRHTNGDLAYIGSHFGSLCHDGPHDIARLKALDDFGSFGFAARKTMLIHQTHLSSAMPLCLDEQGNNPLDPQGIRGTGPDTTGIHPMALL